MKDPQKNKPRSGEIQGGGRSIKIKNFKGKKEGIKNVGKELGKKGPGKKTSQEKKDRKSQKILMDFKIIKGKKVPGEGTRKKGKPNATMAEGLERTRRIHQKKEILKAAVDQKGEGRKSSREGKVR